MSPSVYINKQGAGHRANPGASYASDRRRQPQRVQEIRIWLHKIFNTREIFTMGKMANRRHRSSLIGLKTAGKRETRCFCITLGVLASLLIVDGNQGWTADLPPEKAATEQANAEKLRSEKPPTAVHPVLVSRLTSDFRSAIRDRPLRAALESIATAASVNLWLDRQIDPTIPIRPEADTSTPYQAIMAIARSAGCHAVAVDNVVLVGRAPWVKSVAAAILTQPAEGIKERISWPDLTTPTAAATSFGRSPRSPLPHDLWPAVRWTEMDIRTAHQLIAGQFDWMPSSSEPSGYQKLTSQGKVTAFYPRGPQMPIVRSAVMASDRTATIKEIDSQLLIKADAAAHVAAINAWLESSTPKAPKSLDIDQVRFTLRLENAVAEQVFAQLATAAGRTMIKEPNAADACLQKVSLTANNETLRDLAQRVADSVGVRLSWTTSQLRIDND